jgi:proline iminopeptidase
MTIGRNVAPVLCVVAGYALVVRPRLVRWGATDDEVQRPYPGTGLVDGGHRGATMATTIDAAPADVWCWLVQMGCDRAGWYSWDVLDNGGQASAERIHPEWQEIAIGRRLSSSPSGKTWFEVAALEPRRFLALRASYGRWGRPFDAAGPRPRHYTDSVWCFLLESIPGNRTRLVVSGYASARPQLVHTVQNFVFWEPAHWVMQTRQFANLKRRAEQRVVSQVDLSHGEIVRSAPVGVDQA